MSWFSKVFGRKSSTPRAEVVVLKTRTCPLCEEAVSTLERERRRLPFGLIVRDITDDPSLMARHRDEVPVVFVDGKKRFFGRVDMVLFRRILNAR